MIFFVILLVLVFLAQIIELFIPPLEWMYNAHIYIVPLVVFYGVPARRADDAGDRRPG
jgi:hypothetical protein